jgi:hypothetical protein
MFSGGSTMRKLSLLAALVAVSTTGGNLIPMPSCFNRGDSCPAMGCSAEMACQWAMKAAAIVVLQWATVCLAILCQKLLSVARQAGLVHLQILIQPIHKKYLLGVWRGAVLQYSVTSGGAVGPHSTNGDGEHEVVQIESLRVSCQRYRSRPRRSRG